MIQSVQKHHTSLAERAGGFLDGVGGFENPRGVYVSNPAKNQDTLFYSVERAKLDLEESSKALKGLSSSDAAYADELARFKRAKLRLDVAQANS